jgi:hypothetical protein
MTPITLKSYTETTIGLSITKNTQTKYIWKLKEYKQDFDITWSILKRAVSYTGGSKRCNLCLEENSVLVYVL